MRYRCRVIIAFVLALLFVPIFAWLLNGWAYNRWADSVIEIAHRLERNDPVPFRVTPDYVKVNRQGDVELYFIPPRTAWFVRLTDPDHGMTGYVIRLANRPGIPRVEIDHGLE